MNRNQIAAAIAAFAFIATANHAAGNDLTDICREITKRHDESVKRLQDWIRG